MAALKVVSEDDFPPHTLGGSVNSAAGSGDMRSLLVALRDRIASEIDAGVPARDLASLSRRLLDIAKEIEELDEAGGGDVGEAAATPDSGWEPI